MLRDIQINSTSAINVIHFCELLWQKVNIYFQKNFLIDAQLADVLHYDVTKLN